MFNIVEIKLYPNQGEAYSYNFKPGTNLVFCPSNDSGKTEFFQFIDYLLGGDRKFLSQKEWYNDLEKASITINKDNCMYTFTRNTKKGNSFKIADNEEDECNDKDYVSSLNSLFGTTSNAFDAYSGITSDFRTFEAFNSIERGKALDRGNNFLTKCLNHGISNKTSLIIDFLFSPKIDEIKKLKDEIKDIKAKTRRQRKIDDELSILENLINESLISLNLLNHTLKDNDPSRIPFVRENLLKAKDIEFCENKYTNLNYNLLYEYNDIIEQIKTIEQERKNIDNIKESFFYKQQLLNRLREVLKKNESYAKFIDPITNEISELENNIVFSKALLKDDNLKKLKERRDELEVQVKIIKSRERLLSIGERLENIGTIEKSLAKYETLLHSSGSSIEELSEKKKELEEELKLLIKESSESLLVSFGNRLIELYYNNNDAEIIEKDRKENVFFDYNMSKNSIMPLSAKQDGTFMRGSTARSALLQLCGYCAFAEMLVAKKDIPYMPLMLVDEISNSLTGNNIKAVGNILNTFTKQVGDDNYQIILFDTKDKELLGLNKCTVVPMVEFGFVPWFRNNN